VLTKEQRRVVDEVMSHPTKIIAVNSVAGSGKTSTADAVIRTYAPKQGFYTAFNKAIVTDSAKRFGKLIEAKTIHSLAYKHVRPTRPIEEFNYLTIKEDISYDDKNTIITILDDFFRSSSTDITEYIKSKCSNPDLQELIEEYANKMLDNKISPTFNYMLKCLHLMLYYKQLQLDFDLFVLDECQDTTAVTLEIFKLINADVKIMLGDTYQNIYSFMNTVNAFEELDDVKLLRLTKSFRCNPNIAEIVETYGRKHLDNDFLYYGNPKVESGPSIAYITRTNAMLIERMFNLIQQNQSFTLTRSVQEIFGLPLALLNASQGREVFDKKFKYLEKEYIRYQLVKSRYTNYYDYIVQITEDTLLENIIRMLQDFNTKRINIYKLKENVTNLRPNPNVILTTAHAFKGLEADTVYIENDLNSSVNRAIISMNEIAKITGGNPRDYLTKDRKEDLNTYYVALSRARTSLVNYNYL